MNRKQRKIKKMIARRHTGHAANTPVDKLLGRDCLLRSNFYGLNIDAKAAIVIGVSSNGETLLIHCPYFQEIDFGHSGHGFMDGDRKMKGIEKYTTGSSCYWVGKEDVSFK